MTLEACLLDVNGGIQLSQEALYAMVRLVETCSGRKSNRVIQYLPWHVCFCHHGNEHIFPEKMEHMDLLYSTYLSGMIFMLADLLPAHKTAVGVGWGGVGWGNSVHLLATARFYDVRPRHVHLPLRTYVMLP